MVLLEKSKLNSIKVLFSKPIQDEGGKKAPTTSFSPVTSANERISSQNFLSFSFNLFDRLV